ncbi:MAG: molybdopterin cofactor-binding domain-containing protein [archaeon]
MTSAQSKVTGTVRFTNDLLVELQETLGNGEIVYAIPFTPVGNAGLPFFPGVEFLPEEEVFFQDADNPDRIEGGYYAVSENLDMLLHAVHSIPLRKPIIPDFSYSDNYFISFGPRMPGALERKCAISIFSERDDKPVTFITNSQLQGYVRETLAKRYGIEQILFPPVGGAFGGKAFTPLEESAINLSIRRKKTVVVLLPNEMTHMSPPSIYSLSGTPEGSRMIIDSFFSVPSVYSGIVFGTHINNGGIYDPAKSALHRNPIFNQHIHEPFSIHTGPIRSLNVCQPVGAIEIFNDIQALRQNKDALDYRLEILRPEAAAILKQLFSVAKKKIELVDARIAAEAHLLPAYIERVSAVGVGWYQPGFTWYDDNVKICVKENLVEIRTCYSDFGTVPENSMLMIAAEMLNCSVESIRIVNDPSTAIKDHGASSAIMAFYRMMSFVCNQIASEHDFVKESPIFDYLKSKGVRDLDFHVSYKDDAMLNFEGMSYVVTVADVLIEKDTGRIQIKDLEIIADVGKVYDENSVIAQLRGGAVQSIGDVLFGFSPSMPDEIGLNFNYWHGYPTAMDIPYIGVTLIDSPRNLPLGVGELGSMTMIPTIANALMQVAYRIGKPPLVKFDFPLTPETVYNMLK